MQLLCDSGRLHGDVSIEDAFIEVSCRSTGCGKRAGVLVLHRFSLSTGELLSTSRFKDPASITDKREDREDAPRHCVSVRDA